MAFPKIKLCWNGSRVEARWWLGLFGVYTRGSGGGRLRGLVISLRGLLAWLGALSVVGYFIGAAALWFWLDRRPYNFVTYTDLVLPTRWSEIDKLRGQALIAEGMDDIKARRWGEGLQKLRIGIARYPEDTKGRLMLAELFLAMKARKQAIETYDSGLVAQYPGRKYIETMVRLASQAEDYEWWLRTTDRALEFVAGNPDLADERSWLIRQKLSGLLAAGRSEETLKLALEEGEENSPMIAEFRVLALLKAGRAAEAVAFLDEWSARTGGRGESQVLRLQVRAFREAGDYAGMERALETMRSLSPTDPRPYVYGIVQNALADRSAEAARGMDQFFLRFGGSPQQLQLLAAPLAEVAELGLLQRIIAQAKQQGFELQPFRRHLVETHIARDEWLEAAVVLADFKADPSMAKNDQAALWHELMSARVQAALDAGEGTQSTLVSLVRGRQFALEFYKDVISQLRRAGRPATARQIVTFAQGVYPKNNDIETWRVELDAEIAAAQAAAPVVIVSRPATSEPAATGPVVVREELTEAVFDARLGELTREGKHAEALQYIREVRRTRPAWLTSRDVELARAEVRLNGLAGDVLGTRSAARLYLTGERLRSAQMIEVARELHAAGRKDEAVVLVREILAKEPGYKVAQGLLDQWVQKVPGAPPKS